MGSLGCILGTGRAADSAAPAPAYQAQVQAQAGGGTQTEGSAPGLRGHRLRAAHGLPVEGAAQRALWQRQRDPQAVSGMGEGGLVLGAVAGWAGRVRRDGG